jgi:hypothetical protein
VGNNSTPLAEKSWSQKNLAWSVEVDKYFNLLIVVSKESLPCRQNDLVTPFVFFSPVSSQKGRVLG